jgi:hypothetical protein
MVVASTSEEGRARAEARPKGAMRARLDDSKKLVAFGDTALGEAWARAIARRMGLSDEQVATPDELVHALSLDSRAALRTLCPEHHAAQCWDVGDEKLICSPEHAKLIAKVEKDLAKLEEQGVRIERATCVVTCARRLNDGVDRGLTRFHMDLHAMERLVLDARERAGCDVLATCGKVGGFNSYSSAFGPMSGRLHAIAMEGRARSEYHVPGVGRLAFVRDADAKHVLVCMASLVGKWVRDLLMARIVRYHRAELPDAPDASGYHDPVTTRFISATRLSRKKRGLPDECFERRALGNEGPVTSATRLSSRPSHPS